ncbi:MAG: hypothetical protein KatS3mg022_3420 [Armatimonadota bacterium]|nr:MAG: hypothetical protein KatS3mg022_1442 [Armatimonadota bacterium]GIV16015.1 MAG: hypothetical protein KatS3mg022_1450 [Armatimonadota bacterium]GIV17985.1 MAG: hypothetical protein KatS3mg022_3420 [Armatimonadota bacterium]
MTLEQQIQILQMVADAQPTFSAVVNDVAMVVSRIELALREMEGSSDPFTQWRAGKLRRRFADTLAALAARGIRVPLPVQGVTL